MAATLTPGPNPLGRLMTQTTLHNMLATSARPRRPIEYRFAASRTYRVNCRRVLIARTDQRKAGRIYQHRRSRIQMKSPKKIYDVVSSAERFIAKKLNLVHGNHLYKTKTIALLSRPRPVYDP